MKAVRIHAFGGPEALRVARPNATELTEIGRLIDAGRVHPHVHAVYPFEEVAEAHRALEQGHVRGKWCCSSSYEGLTAVWTDGTLDVHHLSTRGFMLCCVLSRMLAVLRP